MMQRDAYTAKNKRVSTDLDFSVIQNRNPKHNHDQDVQLLAFLKTLVLEPQRKPVLSKSKVRVTIQNLKSRNRSLRRPLTSPNSAAKQFVQTIGRSKDKRLQFEGVQPLLMIKSISSVRAVTSKLTRRNRV